MALVTPTHNISTTCFRIKECIIRGGEPVFSWNGIVYGVCFSDSGYCIARIDGNCEKMCSTPDDVLEYMVGNDCLRDVITKVTVISRTIQDKSLAYCLQTIDITGFSQIL